MKPQTLTQSAKVLATVSTALLLSFQALASDSEVYAEYSVPVPGSLQNYAHFKITKIRYRRHENQVQLQYVLPPELVGPDQAPVTFAGTDDGGPFLALHSENGEASCSQASRAFTCNVRFKNLNVDKDAADHFLQTRSASPEELEGRRQVFRMFSSEGIGVLTYSFE